MEFDGLSNRVIGCALPVLPGRILGCFVTVRRGMETDRGEQGGAPARAIRAFSHGMSLPPARVTRGRMLLGVFLQDWPQSDTPSLHYAAKVLAACPSTLANSTQ